MLIYPANQLGDSALSPEEGLAKLKEENDALLNNRRLHRQSELSDPNRSAGPRLSWNELIFRLSKCNPSLLFKDGSSGNIAVYATRSRRGRAEHEYDPTKPGWYNDHRYVSGFPKDWLPEFSHIITNERNLPTREVRGWRGVLLSLLKARVITLAQADKHFGRATGQRSWSWNQQLHQLKESK